MVMRGKQCFCPNPMMKKFDDRPCQAESIEGARAAANFIENYQALARGVVQNVRGLTHLNHESGLTTREIVAGADAGKDAVYQIDARRLCRHKRTGVREQSQESYLPDVRALTGHV